MKDFVELELPVVLLMISDFGDFGDEDLNLIGESVDFDVVGGKIGCWSCSDDDFDGLVKRVVWAMKEVSLPLASIFLKLNNKTQIN